MSLLFCTQWVPKSLGSYSFWFMVRGCWPHEFSQRSQNLRPLLNFMASQRWKRTEASRTTDLPPELPRARLVAGSRTQSACCSPPSPSHTPVDMKSASLRRPYFSHIFFNLKISWFPLPHNHPLNIERQLTYLSLIFPCLD